MAARSPTLEGFRLTFRLPSLVAGEIAWRWTFGFAATLLAGATLMEYLNTLDVRPVDLLLFRSRQPVLIGRALAHVLAGTAPRLLAAVFILVVALAMVWILLASFGRAATLTAILGQCSEETVAPPRWDTFRFWRAPTGKWRLRSVLGLNFLRAGLAFAAFLGLWASAIIAGLVSHEAYPQPGLVFFVFSILVFMVFTAWSAVNWFLSLASVFVMRDGQDTFGSLGDAVLLCRDHFGAVFAAGSWFGLLHLVFFSVATALACFPIALATSLPKAVTWFAILLITLFYFAVVDYLYVARLTAYVSIVESSLLPPVVDPSPIVPRGAPMLSREEPSYDPEDLILSDLEAAKGM